MIRLWLWDRMDGWVDRNWNGNRNWNWNRMVGGNLMAYGLWFMIYFLMIIRMLDKANVIDKMDWSFALNELESE